MSQLPDAPRAARSAGEGFVRSRAFEVLARAGFLARGLVYGIIGVLALEVALDHGGKLASQKGALREIEQKPLGHALLIAVAIGLGGYASWRLLRAALGHGPEGSDKGVERLGGLASGLVYAAMCVLAIKVLMGTAGSSGNAKKTTADVFDWPAGRWLIGVAGLVMLGVSAYQLYRGVKQKFLEDSKTDEMPPAVRQWIARVGTVGHVARGVVFALVGIFFLKAAIEYDPKEAVGLDGALGKLAESSHGPWLLGAVALGLLAFGVYSVSDARYRRI